MSSVSSSALQANVLVLNRLYMAVQVISVRRALSMLYKGDAEVVHVQEEGYFESFTFDRWLERSLVRMGSWDPDDDVLRSVRFELEAPRIVRLLEFDRLPRQRVKFNRRNLFARDGNRCQYCGKKYAPHELSMDHVIPRSRGGPANWENIVTACLRCNVRKGGRTPRDAGMPLAKAPERPRTSPLLSMKLSSRKYQSWRVFLENSQWSIDLA
jgi:5-methylcytosine-specific restriction endonuclease McrA